MPIFRRTPDSHQISLNPLASILDVINDNPGVDIVMAKRGYSDSSFLLHRILHQKVRNVENLREKIRAFVLVSGAS